MLWIHRVSLLIVIIAMTYIALLPGFNFDAWVPISFMEYLGMHNNLITLVANGWDKLAHFCGAFLILVLGFGSINAKHRAAAFRSTTQSGTLTYALALLSISALALAAEVTQSNIGRQFSVQDILAGLAGGCLALACLPLRAATETPVVAVDEKGQAE